MSEFGTVVEFTPAKDVEVYLHSARPSKEEALRIGYTYFTHVAEGNEKALDALLDELGPILVRRSLLVFSNYAKRTGQKDVAKFVSELRDDITVVRRNAKSA